MFTQETYSMKAVVCNRKVQVLNKYHNGFCVAA